MKTQLQQKLSPPSSQSGFTIVECLLALIIVASLLVSIAPVIILSVANRVQAKRVERATNAAKAYIDGVRAGTYTQPPIQVGSTNLNSTPASSNIPAPTSTGNLNCLANDYCPAPRPSFKLFCIDGDGDGRCRANSPKDMIVQASGYQSYNQNITSSEEEKANKGYQLYVRVYRADAFQESGSLKNSSPTKKAQANTFTGGLGDRKAPQIELTTQIVTSKTNYDGLCSQIGGCIPQTPTLTPP